MTEYTNKAEQKLDQERKERELKLALWKGIESRMADISPDENPYTFNKDDLTSHETLLWCRWLLGWIRQDETLREKQDG